MIPKIKSIIDRSEECGRLDEKIGMKYWMELPQGGKLKRRKLNIDFSMKRVYILK